MPNPGKAPSAQDSASSQFPRLVAAVAAAERAAGSKKTALDRTTAYGILLRALQEQVEAVTAERDEALIQVLAETKHPSHRALAGDLLMSRQRVDQLAAIAAQGGRRRR